MTRAAWVALGVVALTAPLTWAWMAGGFEVYAEGFVRVGNALYAALGLERAVALPRQRFINSIPFVALVLLTPRLGWKRRVGGLAAGLAVIFAAHLTFGALAPYVGDGTPRYPSGLALASDTLPLAIWAVIARDWIAGLARPRAEESRSSE